MLNRPYGFEIYYSKDSFESYLEGFMSLLFTDSPTHANTRLRLAILSGHGNAFSKKFK